MKTVLCIVIFWVTLICDGSAGVNPASFLNIGVGARAIGMGGAFTGVADDATASYWNPAGLGRLEGFQSSLMLQKLSDAKWPGMKDISPNYQFFNVIVPLNRIGILDRGSVGISVILMGIDNIPHTYLDSSGSIKRDVFKDTERAYYLSMGYPLIIDGLLIGGSFKYISQNFSGISGGSAWGWDVDMGIILMLSSTLNIGFMATKGPLLYWESGQVDRDLLKVKIGGSYRYIFNERMNILAACDFIQKKDMPLKASAGMEFSFLPEIGIVNRLNAAKIRGGIEELIIENRYKNIGNLNQTINWSVGAGLDVGLFLFDMQIDYTFSFYRLGSKHRISLILKVL